MVLEPTRLNKLATNGRSTSCAPYIPIKAAHEVVVSFEFLDKLTTLWGLTWMLDLQNEWCYIVSIYSPGNGGELVGYRDLLDWVYWNTQSFDSIR